LAKGELKKGVTTRALQPYAKSKAYFVKIEIIYLTIILSVIMKTSWNLLAYLSG